MKNSLLSNIVTAQISAALAFIGVPVFMISQAPKEFYFLDYSTFISSGLLFAIIFSSLLSLALVLLHGLRLQKIANSLSLFVFAWVVIAGFILPVCASAGMVDPEDIPTNRFNFIVVAIISLGLSALASTTFKKTIVAFLAFVILSTIISSIFSIYSNTDKSGESNDHFALSNKKNILVVSFDGLPGAIISDAIKSNSTFSTAFKDFKFFENAVSQSPATEASLMGEIYGVQDYKSLGENQSDVNQSLEKDLNKYLLTSLVKDSYAYGPYPANIAKRITLQPPTTDTYQRKEKTFDFFSYAIVRLATNRALRFSNWSKNIGILEAYLIGQPLPNSTFVAEFKNHVGPQWDKYMSADILKYDYWVDNLGVSNKEFSVRHLHFVFTHFPVDYDAACTYKGDDNQWYINNQNEEGLRSQTICALNKFSKFLNKLKSLGIYDQSLVVFKSDHGEPSNYFSNYPNNLHINGQGGKAETAWGYSRYRPTLMIKDFGANNTKMARQKELVLLNDLAKTLCANSGLKIRCDYFHGINLLSEELGSVDEPYYIYVPKNSESSFGFDKHVSVKIPSRKIELIKAMEASPLISLSPLVQEAGWTPK